MQKAVANILAYYLRSLFYCQLIHIKLILPFSQSHFWNNYFEHLLSNYGKLAFGQHFLFLAWNGLCFFSADKTFFEKLLKFRIRHAEEWKHLTNSLTVKEHLSQHCLLEKLFKKTKAGWYSALSATRENWVILLFFPWLSNSIEWFLQGF